MSNTYEPFSLRFLSSQKTQEPIPKTINYKKCNNISEAIKLDDDEYFLFFYRKNPYFDINEIIVNKSEKILNLFLQKNQYTLIDEYFFITCLEEGCLKFAKKIYKKKNFKIDPDEISNIINLLSENDDLKTIKFILNHFELNFSLLTKTSKTMINKIKK